MYINQIKTGIELKNRIKNNGYVVMDICRELNVTPAAVYKWMRGLCLPSVDNLIVLSRMFGCSMEDLIVCDDKGK